MKNSDNFFWKNTNLFKKHHDYLQGFFWQSNKNLSKILNNYHRTNLSTKSWTIMLYPWLYYYQSALYDRWNKLIFKKYKNKKFPFKKKLYIINSSNEFFHLSQNDDWNNYIYSKIQNFKNNKTDESDLSKKKTKKKIESNNYLLVFYILKFIRFFYIKSDIFYADSLNFNKKKNFRDIYNYFIFKIVNKIHNKLLLKYNYNYHSRLKISNLVKKLKNNDLKTFENFFYDQVSYDIPCELIEGLKIHIKYSIGFPKIKNIFTKFLHYNNLNFKIFASKILEKKGKLNILEHGGGIPWKSMNFFFEEKIFTKKYTWAKEFEFNQKQFSNFSIKNKYYNIYNKNFDNKKISIITTVIPKYFFKMALAIQNFHYQNYIIEINNFLKNIRKEQKENIFLKLHPSENDKYYKPGYKDLKKKNKVIKFFKKNQDFKYVIQKSKILVCTYPETTFTLSMLSGVPTILILDSNISNLLNPKFKKIIKSLIKSKILFINSTEAATHINKISENPIKWYDSKNVKKAREEYLKIAFN